MRDLLLLAVQLIVTMAKLTRPGGIRSVIAESLLLKHQLIISGCSRRHAPPLTTMDRFVLGLMTLFMRPQRVGKLAAILKPATLLRFHKALVDRKYRRLFSSAATRRKPGPKGPTEEIVAAIIEMKHRNPGFGHRRIAQQISYAFGVQIDKDVVRRILARHYGPDHPGRAPRVRPGSPSSRKPRTASGVWICFVDGSHTYGSWRSRRSNRCPMPRCRTLSSND
jgi:putative transposase